MTDIGFCIRLFFIPLFGLFLLQEGSTQSYIECATIDKPTEINQHIRVFHTPASLDGHQVMQKIRENEIDETELKVNPGMSFPEDHYWIALNLTNQDTSATNIFLEIDYPQLDFIEVFEVDSNQSKILYTTGDEFPFDQRPILSRNYIFPLIIQPLDTSTVLLHLRKFKSAMRFPLNLYKEKAYNSSHFKSNLIYSLYFGIILLVALTSIVLGVILRKSTFVIYSLYILSFGLWLFTRLGYSYQFLIPDFPELNQHLLPVCGQLAIMGLILYVRSFFETHKILPIFHRVMNGILVFFVFGYVIWALFPDEFVAYATKLFILRYALFITTIVFAFVSAIAYRNVDKFRSNMFLLAYSLFLTAILSKIIAEYGVINEFKFAYDPIMIGFLIEVSVLTTAMAIILKKSLQKSSDLESRINDNNQQEGLNGYIILNSKATINTDEIIFVKSDDHYLEYFLTSGKKEIDRNSLSQVIELLPNHFAQTHRSFIVNLNQVKMAYADKLVMNNGEEIKLSRKFKSQIKRMLSNQQLN